MKKIIIIIGLVCLCCGRVDLSSGVQVEGVVRSECRDRHLWIQVASGHPVRFEAVDKDGVHPITHQLAARCGYTISAFKTGGFSTFRASYYSCFTHNKDDQVFTFRLNVVLSDGGGNWVHQSVSAVCPGLTWTHREVMCEEDYMEVNEKREGPSGGQQKQSRQLWQEVSSQAQRKALWSWQLMFLHSSGQISSMSLNEAQYWNYSLTATKHRLVLRAPYNQPQAEVTMVSGVPVEVLQVLLFYRQKLLLVMVDLTMACAVNSGSFDGSRLTWEVPEVMSPLVGEGAEFKSHSFSLGVENVLLDQPSSTSRGFSLVPQNGVVRIGVPFGAEGGYRKSLVVNNVYKEAYIIFLLYEHVFSLMYEDGSSIDTQHRMLRLLETPLICRYPFSLNKTLSEQQVFRVYLGNIPADVVLAEVWINGQLMADHPGFSLSPLLHVNGSWAYELQVPFNDAAVRWNYLGGGVVEYSIGINFTLTIMPQRESYYHHTSASAQVFNTFPPEISAQCLDGGVSFSLVRSPLSLWEVGIDHEPLTVELVAQRGYRLYNDSHKTTLEVPVFSIGYTYENINLSNFYATFKLLLRDSRTLKVQTSTSKRCLFKTQDMIVCSPEGTMTVVATPTITWPAIQPERTTLLDHTCGPKQADGSRVLFEFKLDSCGTRTMIGDWYVVYENEIIYKRQFITDGPNLISRESQFRVTVRCFYSLNAVNRLFMDRTFKPGTPGFGSAFETGTAGSKRKGPSGDCPQFDNDILPAPAAEGSVPHSHLRPPSQQGTFRLGSARRNKMRTDLRRLPAQISSSPDSNISLSDPGADSQEPEDPVQPVPLPTTGSESDLRVEPSGQAQFLDSVSTSSESITDVPVVQPSGIIVQPPEAQRAISSAAETWIPELTWDQFTLDQTQTSEPDLRLHSGPIGWMNSLNRRLTTQPHSRFELPTAPDANYYTTGGELVHNDLWSPRVQLVHPDPDRSRSLERRGVRTGSVEPSALHPSAKRCDLSLDVSRHEISGRVGSQQEYQKKHLSGDELHTTTMGA